MERSHIAVAALAALVVILALLWWKRRPANKEPFEEALTLYHADFCGHCHQLMPKWKAFRAHAQQHKLPITFREVDAAQLDAEPASVRDSIQGFPTVSRNGKFYVGGPAIERLMEELKGQAQQAPRPAELTLHYANGCGHCHRLMPKWLDFKRFVAERGLPLVVKEVEASEATDARVPGYPTVLRGNEAIVGADRVADMIDAYMKPAKKMTLYYSKNCGYCQRLLPKWYAFVDASQHVDTETVEADALRKDPATMRSITAFPTLVVVEGSRRRVIVGQADIEKEILS
jgi:thiol-disulfide isomerase/thioredoxin